MRRLGITQRVESIAAYNERRDCLDQRWFDLAFELGFVPVPLANVAPSKVPDYISNLDLSAIVFSGGNSLCSLNPDAADVASERDAFESSLLKFCELKKIPVVGVCRGMQVINDYFGGRMTPIQGHVATRHQIYPQLSNYKVPLEVNSFHNWGILSIDLAPQLKIIALDKDNNVEAFLHRDKCALGLMWHPERETPFNNFDIDLIKEFLP